MEIRKIAGIAPDDRAAVDEAFAGIEPLPVAGGAGTSAWLSGIALRSR